MFLHKCLFINNLFLLVLDCRLSSSVGFNTVLISLKFPELVLMETRSCGIPVECMEIKAEVKAMKYKQVIILCQIIFSSTWKIYNIFKKVATEEKNLKMPTASVSQ